MAGLPLALYSTLLRCLLKRLQPSDQVWILSPVSEPTLSVEQRFCFGKCLSFGFQIDGEVFVRGVDANVAEPVGNRAKIDSGTQQMDGGAVP